MKARTGGASGCPSSSDDLAARLELLEHREDILQEAHGFGSLLFDSRGRLVQQAGQTWLYTTYEERNGCWTSWVREFDLRTLKASSPRRILVPRQTEERAVIHHVMTVRPDLVLAFYSNGRGVRAATAASPQNAFSPDPDFRLDPELPWELEGRPAAGCALESNGAYVPIEESAEELQFYGGYDSYHPREKRGDISWFHCALDKRTGQLRIIRRDSYRPLPFRDRDWSCARCGGNLSSDFRIDGRPAFFYYVRLDPERLRIALALGADSLFSRLAAQGLVGEPLGRETVVEKFQVVPEQDDFLLFYESKFSDGSWHTGLRRYRLKGK